MSVSRNYQDTEEKEEIENHLYGNMVRRKSRLLKAYYLAAVSKEILLPRVVIISLHLERLVFSMQQSPET